MKEGTSGTGVLTIEPKIEMRPEIILSTERSTKDLISFNRRNIKINLGYGSYKIKHQPGADFIL